MPTTQPDGRVIALNAGSSSLKFGLFAPGDRAEAVLQATGSLTGIGSKARFEARAPSGHVLAERTWNDRQPSYDELLADLLAWTEAHQGGPLLAAGHRVVHGGRRFTEPVVVGDLELAQLEAFIPLAPLHQPHSLALIRSMRSLHPGVPQVACFDTAFHSTNSRIARLFGLPRALEGAGLIRYGFHGLSYEYVSGELSRRDPKATAGRTVIAHLGNGASLCALVAGRSVATTMGFSVLDGLLMGTRPGSLDPEVILYLQRERKMTLSEVEDLLYNKSGLLGVSGLSADMRDLHASRSAPAVEAVELFLYRLQREIGSMVAAAGGLDTLVFTAGIGENDALVRTRACESLGWLGVEIETAANGTSTPGRISALASRVAVWVIPTSEETAIARHTVSALQLGDT